jgi:putative oxidoreductase
MNRLKNWSLDDWGRLLLRLTIGGLMLFHGVAKLDGGMQSVTALVKDAGLPGFVAWGVLVGELVAPLMLILGLYARAAGVVLAFNMLVAILLAHAGDILKLGEYGEWAIELQMLYLLGGLSIALLGSGSITVANRQGKKVELEAK